MSASPRTPATGGKNDPAKWIRRDTPIAEIVEALPDAQTLLAQYGLHCFHCSANAYETLEEGCRSHGFEDADIEDLVRDLRILLAQAPTRPLELILTHAAAVALRDILQQEGEKQQVLVVTLDSNAAFCMECADAVPQDHLVFQHPQVSEVRVCASTTTLRSIGGATIDFREGRYKLDLPTTNRAACACAQDGSCGCAGK